MCDSEWLENKFSSLIKKEKWCKSVNFEFPENDVIDGVAYQENIKFNCRYRYIIICMVVSIFDILSYVWLSNNRVIAKKESGGHNKSVSISWDYKGD